MRIFGEPRPLSLKYIETLRNGDTSERSFGFVGMARSRATGEKRLQPPHSEPPIDLHGKDPRVIALEARKKRS